MNVFVPEGADGRTPIFMRNYVGGYMAAKAQGIDVDFKLPWNRPHAGDYALGGLFTWLSTLCKRR
ncbi:MAG: hypothetical protein ACI3YT_01310 [Prevotella sp.]